MNEESIYVGNAKEIQRDGKDSFLSVQVDLTVLQDKMIEIDPYIKKVKFKDGEHRLLNLVVFPLKPENRTEYKTHSVKVDKYIPGQKKWQRKDSENQEPRFKQEDLSQDEFNDDIPF